jgi:hypothetical protein
MSRQKPAIALAAIPLHAPPMTLAEAVRRLPADKKAFDAVRFRWIDVVRGCPLLTASQRQVGLAIAQNHINHNPENRWFHSAWAGHQRIADEIGLTRRTVVTAMAALNRVGLVAIAHGGGVKVPGGRTDRYTLRIDRLDLIEGAAQIFKQNDVKKLGSIVDQFGQSGEKNGESGEIGDQMIGNSRKEDVKAFHTTSSKTTPLESLLTTHSASASETLPVATRQASNGRKESSDSVTAQDHFRLAVLLGDGNIARGYSRLYTLKEADADELAIRFRRDQSSGEAICEAAARLEGNLGRLD